VTPSRIVGSEPEEKPIPTSADSALKHFDPAVGSWFREEFGAPTEIQRLAWPVIAAGEHALITAPTGSGKTLTGFLWPLDRLLTGAWPGGRLRVLYVSPLKALNSDIERNLRQPLAGIEERLLTAGREPVPVRIGLRSGDTPATERARQVRRPPEILITTPESLNLLLLSKGAPALFGGLRLVLLDEIHAVAGTKRGTHLITAVERLTRLAGEFQRVGISATARPPQLVARFVGGSQLRRGAGGETRYEPRAVRIVESHAAKRYDLTVRFPFTSGEVPAEKRAGDEFWRRTAAELSRSIGEVRSTLVFTNSRRTAEKITRFVNEAAGRDVAWSHHGSLSRELRGAVERRLKEGSLPAIVATSSLELGIDIGALDRVVLLQSPRSLASAAQRIGRAGHRAGEVSRAIFLPTHPRDFLDAAVATRAVEAGEIEPLRPIRAPLDVLAQTVLAMVASERWQLDELFDFLRTADPYRELSRTQFDLVIEMLAGRYEEVRIEELKPRLRLDRIDGTVEGRPGLTRLVAQSGGTIPDRGYFPLRLEESNARLGELDEEFVWERSVGDTFVLGAQAWRIRSISAQEVLVSPARGGAVLAPFWRADARDRGAFFSLRVGELLADADRRLDEPAFERELAERHGFEPDAAAELLRLLREQKAALGVELPHRRHVVLEECAERAGDRGRRQVILYTFWGGTVNRPLALALAALWEEREGVAIEALSDDDAVLLSLPEGADARALLLALEPERMEALLRRRLEASGFFGAHFRQNAQRALLLPRAAPTRRTPLWVSRQNAKKLLDAVSRFDDFPLVLETWRTCLQDEFELAELRSRLEELARGEIRVSSVRSERPSPFAANLVWRRTNEQMYEDDVPEARRSGVLRADLVREVALAADGRPAISRRLAERFRRTAQRLLPGYPPRDEEELLEWLRERLWIDEDEWRELCAAIDAERRGDEALPAAADLVAAIDDKLAHLDLGGPVVAAAETALLVRGITPLRAAFEQARGASEAPVAASPSSAGSLSEAPKLARLLGMWLRFHPPLSQAGIARRWGLDETTVAAAVDELVAAEEAVRGRLLDGDGGDPGELVAARSTFETLLRWRRGAERREVAARPLEALPFFVAARQGLVERAEGSAGLRQRLESLFGYPAPAGAWERDILPARLDPYLPSWLDAALEESDLGWFGAGSERVLFAFPGDLDLLGFGIESASARMPGELSGAALEVLGILEPTKSGLDFADIVDASGRGSEEIAAALWELVWRGAVSHDAIRTLRQGVLGEFRAAPPAVAAAGGESRSPGATRSRRSAFRRWSASRPFGGRWRRLVISAGGDAVDEEERHRERVRLLADRYGVLFRELLAYELPELSWRRISRTLRTLELGGELVGGHYFEGISGLQFAAPGALRALDAGLPEGAVWWHAATDPASLCGVDLPRLKSWLPRRVAGTFLVWHGERLALVIRRMGRELEFAVDPGSAVVPALLRPLEILLTRAFDPLRSIEVETINGMPAGESDYLPAFSRFSRARTAKGVRLRRSYSGS